MKKILFTILALLSIQFLWAQVKNENGHLVTSVEVKFATGTATLLSESEKALAEIKQFLNDKESITLIRVEGHVSGGASASQELSQQRAVAVCNWLINNGISCTRVLPVGFGSNKPVADNLTPENRAANTRIHFQIVALRNKLIGGMPADGGGVALPICD
ncbi:MAG: OmpA family protein [Ferruginibacter sp.]